MSLGPIRLGHAAASEYVSATSRHAHLTKRASTCTAAQMYTYPTSATTVQVADDLTLTWNTSCLSTENVDIYLYSYQTSSSGTLAKTGMIHAWVSAPWSSGKFAVGKLDPTWWNSTADASLQVSMVEAGQPIFFATPGPIFSAHATSDELTTTSSVQTSTATDGSQSTATDGSGIFQTVALAKAAGLSKGALAAAIVVPIIVVGVLIGLYIKFARMKEVEKRKRWSEHVDKRMSAVSGDWRSGGGSIANGVPGPRMSMASNATRATSTYFSNGNARGTMYSVSAESNMAGAGANGSRIPRIGAANSEMRNSQLRHSAFGGNGSQGDFRQSRISFAEERPGRKSGVSLTSEGLRPTKSNLSGLNNPTQARRSILNADKERSSIDSSNRPPRFSQYDTNSQDLVTMKPSQEPDSVSSTSKKGLLTTLGNVVGIKDKSASKTTDVDLVKQDLQQAEATRQSGEAMRDMENATLRRSQAHSQYSLNQAYNENTGHQHTAGNDRQSVWDNDRVEELSGHSSTLSPSAAGHESVARATSPMGMAMPVGGMNPDQLLAAYAAARTKTPAASAGLSIEMVGLNGDHDASSESPNSMRLGNSLRVPAPLDNTRQSLSSDVSAYSTTTGLETTK